MLSYRHAFHAGSFADVLKHAVLVHVLRHAVAQAQADLFPGHPCRCRQLRSDLGHGAEDRRVPGRDRQGAGGRRRRCRSCCDPIWSSCAPPTRRASCAPIRARRRWRGRSCGRRTGMELVELHGTDHGLLEEWAGRRGVGAAQRRARGAGPSAAAARAPGRGPDRPELRDQERLRGRGGRTGARASTLCHRGVPALVPGDRARPDRGADDRADRPPAFPASSGSSCPRAPTRPAAA